jgi:DNA repair protein RAD16
MFRDQLSTILINVFADYSNIFSLITRSGYNDIEPLLCAVLIGYSVRQMACHPDLVLRSKRAKYIPDVGEEVVCRICNDVVSETILLTCA